MAKVKIQGHASGTGVLTVTAPNTSTDRTITLPDATGTLLNSDGSGVSLTNVNAINGGRKNMVINGAMQVSQRQGTSSFALTNDTFGIDRFKYVGQTSRLTSQQVTDSPAGFNYSYKLTSAGANTPSSSDGSGIWIQLEGDDVGHLNYGTSDAQTTTLSFWVKSSLTGTFGGSFGNGAINRSYPFTYAISSANTWEKKSITVAGDTTGTWVTTGNGYGLRIKINTGTGSNFNGSSAGSWTGADRRDVSGTVQLEATSGATLQITGVQLELGSTATDFEYRSYGEELALCQRYYEIVADASQSSDGSIHYVCGGFSTKSDQVNWNYFFQVVKRGTFTLEATTGTDYYKAVNHSDNIVDTAVGMTASYQGLNCVNGYISGSYSGSTEGKAWQFTLNNASAKIAVSAEL